MKLISHRGNLQGPQPDLENHPEQITRVLNQGYDCEVDLWLADHQLWLGHDQPQHKITRDFLEHPGLWIHAKNLDALVWLTTTDLNYFWHQNDDYVITSHHYIWAYPGRQLTARSVAVMPEWNYGHDETRQLECFAICSDFVAKIKN